MQIMFSNNWLAVTADEMSEKSFLEACSARPQVRNHDRYEIKKKKERKLTGSFNSSSVNQFIILIQDGALCEM